jgi:predicted dehydrogenase
MLNQRTNPAFIKLKKMITSGELGKIHRYQWTITDWFRTNYYYKFLIGELHGKVKAEVY